MSRSGARRPRARRPAPDPLSASGNEGEAVRRLREVDHRGDGEVQHRAVADRSRNSKEYGNSFHPRHQLSLGGGCRPMMWAPCLTDPAGNSAPSSNRRSAQNAVGDAFAGLRRRGNCSGRGRFVGGAGTITRSATAGSIPTIGSFSSGRGHFSRSPTRASGNYCQEPLVVSPRACEKYEPNTRSGVVAV
jgi:hypothetical protein